MKIQETFQGDLKDHPRSQAVASCEQGCLTSVEYCEENQENDVDSCRAAFRTCIEDCKSIQ